MLKILITLASFVFLNTALAEESELLTLGGVSVKYSAKISESKVVSNPVKPLDPSNDDSETSKKPRYALNEGKCYKEKYYAGGKGYSAGWYQSETISGCENCSANLIQRLASDGSCEGINAAGIAEIEASY